MAVQKFPLNFDCRDIAMEALIAAQEASDRGEERDSGGGGEKEQNKGAGGEKEQEQGAEGAREQGAEGEKELRRRCCELQEQLDEAKSEGAVAQVRGGNSSGVEVVEIGGSIFGHSVAARKCGISGEEKSVFGGGISDYTGSSFLSSVSWSRCQLGQLVSICWSLFVIAETLA